MQTHTSTMSLNYSKLIGCNIYGSVRITPLALKIIDTPEFQRMRNIKQLGLCHYVYPAATHTRFEHSIGVYHLAGKMLDKIKLQYPNMEFTIPELDKNSKIKLNNLIIECIKIAALCHDIGHGPFSHVFDNELLKKSPSNNRTHEVRSCLITEILCRRELSEELSDNHIEFIKAIIDPNKNVHKTAIYQIVANKLNGIDVDKLDYLVRDAQTLGLEMFNASRLIEEFIIDSNENIAYPKHCSTDIYEMFHNRYMMHKKVYSHKTVRLIDQMMYDIFIKVDNIFGISESIEDMSKFCKLTDNSIYNMIQFVISPPEFMDVSQVIFDQSKFDKIVEANNLYSNIICRKLYHQIDRKNVEEFSAENFRNFIEHIRNKYPLLDNKICLIETKIGFVSQDNFDPFRSIYFYDKKEKNETFVLSKTQISSLMNNKIQEKYIHLVSKDQSISKLVSDEFKDYFKKKSNNSC